MRPRAVVSRLPLIAPLILLLPALCAVRADEMVWLTNGSFLRVVSHSVEGDMIRVHLDSNASMAFPLKMVDKIEKAEAAVSSQTVANQSFPSQAQAPRPGGFDAGAAKGVPPPPMAQGMPQRSPLLPGGAKGAAESQQGAAGESLIDRFNHGFTNPGTAAVPGTAIDPRSRLPLTKSQNGAYQLAPRKEGQAAKDAQNGDPQDPK